MNSHQITQLIREAGRLLDHEGDTRSFAQADLVSRTYPEENLSGFIRDLIEEGNKQRVIFLENSLSEEDVAKFLKEVAIPIVVFEKQGGQLVPTILHRKKGKWKRLNVEAEEKEEDLWMDLTSDYTSDLYTEQGKVIILGVFAYKSLVSDEIDNTLPAKKLSPPQRLFRLLSEEKKDITYIYIYAVFIGLISLSLPLGIQATVSLISGGVIFSSIYILITLVILGVLAAGGLQIMQISLVEHLQRRVFTKAAFEFAFRVPRIKAEALWHYHAPELMNRFFDVLTIQKGLPKLLIDLSSSIIQILFGLILLSFYHPFFVFFSIILVGILSLIFYVTGPKGLDSSIHESKYKYKVVYWLEELARTINSFKLSGNTFLPIRKTDYNVNNYLTNRKTHFGVLISQYSFVLIFKALVTGGLLIIGTILVVQREITLGQFVASEVIIILILNSVEKIIMYMDVVYDMLTAVDKIAHVTDLPLERSGGLNIPQKVTKRGFSVRTKDLSYKSPGRSIHSLNKINLTINEGEHICLSGRGGSGKTVLSDTISGLNTHYEGIITIDGYSLRDLDLMNLRDKVGKNVSQEDIFEGSILENILLSKPHLEPADAMKAIETVGIADKIHEMPEGLNTMMVSGGKGLPKSLVNRIILARCLAKNPNLLILNDFFNDFFKSERLELIQLLTQPDNNWTLLVVSNDPLIMAACDRVLLMEAGSIKEEGTFNDLMKKGVLNEIIG
jgi:ABC-type bacteriocin/lantibiotic exporter with double-glycine peptidase domain